MIVLPMIVHEPERRGMAERLVPVPDDELTRRAHVTPLM